MIQSPFRLCCPVSWLLAAIFVCLGLPGCTKKEPAAAAATEPTPQESAATLEELAGKAPVKLVWMEGPKLYGFDSVQPSPPRLLRESAAMERPLLTPDGAAVVYSEAGQIHALTFATGETRPLTAGFAAATWRHPETKRDWVYAAENAEGASYFRFSLHDPVQREEVWKNAPIDPRSVQVSRDGKRLAGLFYGADAGTADLAAKRWSKFGPARPVALAPDTSHIAALLDGTGRQLRFFHPATEPWDEHAENITPPASWHGWIQPNPWTDGLRFDSLRWSNHARLLALSAPREPRARLALAALSPDGLKIERQAVLSAAGPAARFVDAWVGAGETATLADWPATPEAYYLPEKAEDTSQLKWPASKEGAAFIWSTNRAINHLPGRSTPCRVTPHGTARFGEWGDMRLDGGTFEADADSARAIAAGVSQNGAFTLQMLLTESTDQEGPIACRLAALQLSGERDAFSLSRVDDALVFRVLLDAQDGTPAKEYQSLITPMKISSNRTMSLLIEVRDGLITWIVDGQTVGISQPVGPPSFAAWKAEDVQRLVFGDAQIKGDVGWRARLEKILICHRQLTWREINADRATAHDNTYRRSGELIRTRAILREATPFPPPAPGARCLTQHVYEVTEVLSGRLQRVTLPVWHWAVLDGQPVASLPREIGQEYELLVSPLHWYPELEFTDTYLGSLGRVEPAYFDVSLPQTPPKVAAASAASSDPKDNASPR